MFHAGTRIVTYVGIGFLEDFGLEHQLQIVHADIRGVGVCRASRHDQRRSRCGRNSEKQELSSAFLIHLLDKFEIAIQKKRYRRIRVRSFVRISNTTSWTGQKRHPSVNADLLVNSDPKRKDGASSRPRSRFRSLCIDGIKGRFHLRD